MAKDKIIVKRGEVAFVAKSLKYGISSQGKTEAEARENLQEAIELFLEEKKVI